VAPFSSAKAAGEENKRQCIHPDPEREEKVNIEIFDSRYSLVCNKLRTLVAQLIEIIHDDTWRGKER
jgi:hypothetical protein